MIRGSTTKLFSVDCVNICLCSIFFGLSPLGEKRSYDFTAVSLSVICQYVSMSVGKRIFSKTTHRIFLKLLVKLGCLKGKKLTEPTFWEKISFWGYCP